jgi:hypothetical protein
MAQEYLAILRSWIIWYVYTVLKISMLKHVCDKYVAYAHLVYVYVFIVFHALLVHG